MVGSCFVYKRNVADTFSVDRDVGDCRYDRMGGRQQQMDYVRCVWVERRMSFVPLHLQR